jgi:hypothetical protein
MAELGGGVLQKIMVSIKVSESGYALWLSGLGEGPAVKYKVVKACEPCNTFVQGQFSYVPVEAVLDRAQILGIPPVVFLESIAPKCQ